VDVVLGALELEVEQLRHDDVGAVVIDLPLEEDDPVLEEPAVDVEDPLFAAALLHDVGDGGHGGVLLSQPGSPNVDRQPGAGR
jgi:hypothetical protein